MGQKDEGCASKLSYSSGVIPGADGQTLKQLCMVKITG